jgi:adenylate kinase family enzyme
MTLHLFGASGTGITTLGQALARELTIPYFDSDDYFWMTSDPPFTIRRDPEERNAAIRRDLDKHDQWILGGSIIHWGEEVFPNFDLIVFCWLPHEVRMARLKAREFSRYGDIIFSDPDRNKQYKAFLAWAADYDKGTGIASRTIGAHEQWLKMQRCPILEIRKDLTTEQRLELIREALRLMHH